MENLKIKVNSESESKEAQELFFKLGLYWFGSKDELHSNRIGVLFTTNLHGKDIMTFSLEGDAELPNHKEITLPELRDMVVLKRNDIKDATHTNANCKNKYYVCSNGDVYIWEQQKWASCFSSEVLKPISHEKEYINKTTGEYRKTANVVSGEQWIEVPSGANIYALANDGLKTFWSDDYQWLDGKITRYIKKENPKYTFKEWALDWNASILWKRPAQLASINAQYAEIEKFRQEQNHSHYKKDVSGLDFVDVYRVLKLFDVTDPCVQHAVKKLLCSGQRGVKSVDKDVQEAIDSLLRYQEMKKEDLK